MYSFVVNTTLKKQIVNITDTVEKYIEKAKLVDGLCFLFVAHTTACLTVADLDPGTDLDFLDAIEKMVPQLNYRHPHNPSHVGDHIMSSIIGPSSTIFVQNSKLVLGSWQEIVLVELDGPRERNIYLNVLHENA